MPPSPRIPARFLTAALLAATACAHPGPDVEHADGKVDDQQDAPLRAYSLEQLAVMPSSSDWGVRFRLTDAQGRADAEARPARLGYAGSLLAPSEAPRLAFNPSPYPVVPVVPCLLVMFDQAVDRELLQRDARFEVAGQVVRARPVPWDIAARFTPPCGSSVDSVLAGLKTEMGAAFVPERMLPPSTQVVFRSGRVQGLANGLGAPEVTASMQTQGPFVVLPEGTVDKTNIGMDFNVRLSSPLRGKLSPERISISPPAHLHEVDTVGDTLRLKVFGEPNRKYAVTLPADLEDVSGQRLGEQARTATIFAQAAASLLRGPHGMVVLAPGEVLPLESFGVHALAVRVQHVEPEEVARSFFPSDAPPDAELFSERAKSQEIEVADPWDYTRTPLTLEQFGASGPGLYMVEINGRSRLDTRQRSAFWVQRTRLNLSVRFRARSVLARLTETSSGMPVPNARVGFSDGVSVATDADGWVKLPLPSNPAKAGRLLVARSGDETVFGSANFSRERVADEADRVSAHSSKDLRRRALLRVAAYSDRDVYFPKEKVVFHGYVRRLTDDVPGIANTGLPRSLRFALRANTGVVLAEANAALDPNGEFTLELQLPNGAPEYGGATLTLPSAPYFALEHVASIRIVPRPTRGWESALALSRHRVHRGETLSAAIDVHDAEGRPLPGQPVNMAVEAIALPFAVPGHEDFFAGGYDGREVLPLTPSGLDALRHRAQLKTDASGKATLQITPEQLQHPIRYVTSVKTVAWDAQGKTFAQRKDFIVDPAERYAALRVDLNHSYITTRPWTVDLLGVDRTGNVIAGLPIHLRVTAGDQPDKELASCQVVSTLAPVTCTLPALTHEGPHVLVAEVVDSAGRRSMSRQVVRGWPGIPGRDAMVPARLVGPDAWEQLSELEQRALTVTLAQESTEDRRVRVVARVTDKNGNAVSGARLAWMSVDEEAAALSGPEATPLNYAFQGPYFGEGTSEMSSYRPYPLPEWKYRPFRCGNETQPVEHEPRMRARPLLFSDFRSRSDAKGEGTISFELPADAGAVVTVIASRNAAEFGHATLRVPGAGPSCRTWRASCP